MTNFVPRGAVPHDSHEMSGWSQTILSPSGTPRFYNIRHCKNCGAEEADGNAHIMDEELQQPCTEGPSHDHQ